tara:strand:- start:983 stop:1321 length:339 start_codon:yes stop_codon:yes gene_type:complete
MNVTTYEGNTRQLAFQLRRVGVRGGWDVSSATEIRLEVSRPDGTSMTPIVASSGHAAASWPNGLVALEISASNVTATIGTYRYALTLDIGGETITAAVGSIEVRDRPGYPVA